MVLNKLMAILVANFFLRRQLCWESVAEKMGGVCSLDGMGWDGMAWEIV